LLTTTYQSEGKRWIVVPMVMVTLTLAGVWYGWLRLWAGSIWPVSLSHSAFNNLMEGVAGVAIATFAGDDGGRDHRDRVVTMIIMVLVAGYLLTRRAADFDKAEPNPRGRQPIRAPLHERQVGGHPLDQLPGDPFLIASAILGERKTSRAVRLEWQARLTALTVVTYLLMVNGTVGRCSIARSDLELNPTMMPGRPGLRVTIGHSRPTQPSAASTCPVRRGDAPRRPPLQRGRGGRLVVVGLTKE
jgi:hypothetical protein